MSDDSEEIVCAKCSKPGTMSEPISVVLAYHDGFEKPYPLIPAEDYTICMECDETLVSFINRAVQSHPTTRSRGEWDRAVVVLWNGKGFDISAHRPAAGWGGVSVGKA